MNSFWDAIDISENLNRTMSVVRRMSGVPAWAFGVICLFMLVATSALAWTFDIQSTLAATDTIRVRVGGSVPGRFAQYLGWIFFALTIAPTMIEIGGAAFAKAGSTPWQWLVVALSIFDLWTDARPVNEFLYASWFFFEQFGAFTYPVYWVAWVLWLACSSFFFEMVSICLFVAVIGLFLRGFTGRGERHSSSMGRGAAIEA